MKVANVNYKYCNEIVKGLIVENLSDIELLKKRYDVIETRVIHKLIKSDESPDRYNHVYDSLTDEEKAIARFAMSMTSIRDVKNPLYLLGESSLTKLNTITKMLLKSSFPVFLNPYGGVTYVDGSIIELVEIFDFDGFKDKPRSKIKDNSKVITFENDHELERNAVEELYKLDKNFSFVTELRLFKKNQLLELTRKFVKQGGTTLYVYTTGIDVEQMYEYSEIAIQAGIQKFIFNFNCGINKDIQKFIDWLKTLKTVEIN
jgi:hypothetical protein